MTKQRIRIRFRKEDDLRWIGHRDLLRAFERLFRRARLPLAMSEGFHPKPQMSFPSALAVGIRGLDEVMEVRLAQEMTAESVEDRLAAHVPAGLVLTDVSVVEPQQKKPQVVSMTYEMPIPQERC